MGFTVIANRQRLFSDPIFFSLALPDLNSNILFARQIAPYFRSVIISHSAWFAGGQHLISALFEIEKFNSIILDLRYIGSPKEFDWLLEILYDHSQNIAIVISGNQAPERFQKFYEANQIFSYKYKKPRFKLLLDQEEGSSEKNLKEAKYFDGIIIKDQLLSKYDGLLCGHHILVRSGYEMPDIYSLDTTDKSYILRILRSFDHLIYSWSQTLFDSLTALDVLKHFLEINNIL